MRLLFVADLHYALKQFDWVMDRAREYDCVAIGGDLLDLSSSLDSDLQIVVVEKYLDRLRGQSRVLVSSGNHDGDGRNEANEAVAAWLLEAKAEGLFVDWDSMDLAGWRVTICPWWDGPVSRAKLEAMLEWEAARLPDRWLWLHHAPPTGSPVNWTGMRHGGDDALRGWIERFGPDVVLSGHIHQAPFYAQGSWIDRIGRTWVFNPGRQPGPSPTYISLDLTSMVAEWVSAADGSVRRLAVSDG